MGLDMLKKQGGMGGMGDIEISIKFCPKKHGGMEQAAPSDNMEQDDDMMDKEMEGDEPKDEPKDTTVIAFMPKKKTGKMPFEPKMRGKDYE